MITTPRETLNEQILQLIDHDQHRFMVRNPMAQWTFKPELALNIVDSIFTEKHKRHSGRCVRDHFYAVGGYNEQRELVIKNLPEQEQILGIFHDFFEDTRLKPEDSLEWGIAPETVRRLKLTTRYEFQARSSNKTDKEAYCDYIEILANDRICAKNKYRDTKDNYTTDPHHSYRKRLKKAVTMAYLKAIIEDDIPAGTSFIDFAEKHPEKLPTDEYRQHDIEKWIQDNSTHSQEQTFYYQLNR